VNDVALWRRLLAELLGSAFLAAVVIGSGIAAQNLSPGAGAGAAGERGGGRGRAVRHHLDVRAAVSGAISTRWFRSPTPRSAGCAGGKRRPTCPFRWPGASAAPWWRNLMFSEAAVSISAKHRASPAHFLSEIVATLGLILVIFALARTGRSRTAPAAVGAYIGAAYFFTSSASFANPAITVAGSSRRPSPG